MRQTMTRFLMTASMGAALLAGASMLPAHAQVVYAYPPDAYPPHAGPERIFPFGIPQDESYGTSPSFYVGATPLGPGVAVVERCQYPNGWNATDFVRDVNGTPAGVEHTCPVVRYPRVKARY